MSKTRYTKPPYRGQKGRCAWCGTTDLPKGRVSWCSQKCVNEYLSRSSSEHLRRAVFKRDKGICALCGCDSEAAYRAWKSVRMEISRLADWLISQSRQNVEWHDGRWQWRHGERAEWPEMQAFRKNLLDKYLPGRWTPGRKTGWDADHIVPVVEGGGECDLDNLRTLCHPCHKLATAELAARRATAKRAAKIK